MKTSTLNTIAILAIVAGLGVGDVAFAKGFGGGGGHSGGSHSSGSHSSASHSSGSKMSSSMKHGSSNGSKVGSHSNNSSSNSGKLSSHASKTNSAGRKQNGSNGNKLSKTGSSTTASNSHGQHGDHSHHGDHGHHNDHSHHDHHGHHDHGSFADFFCSTYCGPSYDCYSNYSCFGPSYSETYCEPIYCEPSCCEQSAPYAETVAPVYGEQGAPVTGGQGAPVAGGAGVPFADGDGAPVTDQTANVGQAFEPFHSTYNTLPGDSFYTVSLKEFGTSKKAGAIAEFNEMSQEAALAPGQELYLPSIAADGTLSDSDAPEAESFATPANATAAPDAVPATPASFATPADSDNEGEEQVARTKVPAGSTLLVDGQDFGSKQGSARLRIGGGFLKLPVAQWTPNAVKVSLPNADQAGSTQADLEIVRADGSIASRTSLEVDSQEQVAANN